MERYEYTPQERAILEGLQQPFAVYQFVDNRVVPLILSKGFSELFGFADLSSAYSYMNLDMYRNIHPDDISRIADAAVRFMTDDEPYNIIYRVIKSETQGYHIIHAIGKHVLRDSGVRLAEIWYTDEGVYSDDAAMTGTGLNASLNNALHEESMLKASHYDYLTGLPNLAYFFELAESGKTSIINAGSQPVLLFMDLNGMKFFNSKNGFSEGDRLLRAFADLLAQTFRKDRCCHIGSDHFAAFMEEDGMETVLQKLFQDCAKLNGGESLPVRVGIYPNRLEDVPVSIAVDRAKIACDAIRNVFESVFHYYDERLKDEAERRQYILTHLDQAIQEGWIQAYYQPIVRAVNGHVCDEEALARWIDPERGFLSPAEFIPYLEDAALIYKLDLHVLELVLKKMKDQKASGLHIVPHSVNLSRSDFSACDIVEEIRRRVDESGISRDRITIEITESTVSRDFDFMKNQISRFQELGFEVWMDDFGSGYSSMDVLQSVKFDTLKFDMSFMQKLDEGESGKIILTELIKMATALGLDTVCEGVETESQAHFLREIGCSKLQGFYYCRPIPLSEIVERYDKGIQIGYENPEEAAYYEVVGKVNLYDFNMIAGQKDNALYQFFNVLPMGIIEINGDSTRFMRSNSSYREFIKRFVGLDLSFEGSAFARYSDAFMNNVVRTCCELGTRAFYDEKMPDGSVVHSFARRIGINPVNGNIAVAIVVLSISDPNEAMSYSDIARALASDYYNIYAVDLETERFIEYTSPVGGESLAMERHGEDFFAITVKAADIRIYEEDREWFLNAFTKENIVRELDEHGVFTIVYRLIDTGAPMYASMKITRMDAGGSRIILGISLIDSQMEKQILNNTIEREKTAYGRVLALSGDYLALYTVDPKTGNYIQYSGSADYRSLGFDLTGEDFFAKGIEDGKRTVYEKDLPVYLSQFTKENVLREVAETGMYQLQYHLVINGLPQAVILKIVSVRENDGEKLIAGVRKWRDRR
ncbi:MAG: GGDEF domain-containing protein [Solobacterium sp.]|nr:GGDEF domain-containing protein [Solobacterium sp.]